ncbi:hypothetical protein ACF1G5_31225 [Streptomyces coeruleorubidus]|uniref:hypothetical protein n=1 Tax=Streptomyces coeruleorubidus TaxID=116188 RepID=UPI0036F6A750
MTLEALARGVNGRARHVIHYPRPTMRAATRSSITLARRAPSGHSIGLRLRAAASEDT